MSEPSHFDFMQRCLDLAEAGTGKVSPNPMVGCVIVRAGAIVGEGYHRQFGGAHAEIHALEHAGKKARGATMYVNLEPCTHFGKTPPCVDAIIKEGISRIYVAARDPNPLVSGRGIRKLRKAGIRVHVGILQQEATLLNEKFFKFMKSGTPYVAIKLAQTLDGRIADVAGKSKWITSTPARTRVHALRSEYDAVLVGANTVRSDNPELTVRMVRGRNPVRIVLDGRLSLPASARIFRTTEAPTWLLTSKKNAQTQKRKVRQLTEQGVRVLEISAASDLAPRAILKKLGSEGISSLLIEGGTATANSFLAQSLADRLYLMIAPKIFGGGAESIRFHRPRLLRDPKLVVIKSVSRLGEDMLIEAELSHE